jgi:hypothetical protein
VALATSSSGEILTELGDWPGGNMAARLLLALTALYAQRPTHTVEEQQQYVELALRLIDKVETATRTAVADILQRYADAPAEIVQRLGGGQSSRDGDLVGEPHSIWDQHCAGNQHFESNRYLADRECALTPALSDTPAVRQLSAPFPPAHGAEEEFGEAFFAASPMERRRLLSLIPRGRGDDVQAAAEDSAHGYRKVNAAALQGRGVEFAREFAQLIDIPNSLCERILNDPSGEPMVVAAKAAGMPIAILQRTLLLVSASASYSVQRVYDLTDLYHGLDGRAARDLLAQWRTQAKPDDPIPEAAPNTPDRRPDASRPPPDPPPPGARASRALHGQGTPDSSALANKAGETFALPGKGRVGASLRSRFGALSERLLAVNARPGQGSVARRGLRSR